MQQQTTFAAQHNATRKTYLHQEAKSGKIWVFKEYSSQPIIHQVSSIK